MNRMNQTDGHAKTPTRQLKWLYHHRNGAIASFVLIVLIGGYSAMMKMPGKSYRGPLPPLNDREKELESALQRDVENLANAFPDRNLYNPQVLSAAADFLDRSMTEMGYQVHHQEFRVLDVTCHNLEVVIPGRVKSDEVVVVGAHYDAVEGCPAANDNGSGVAALLALARAFVGKPCGRTLRFVAFANEEPPWFQTSAMGSAVYAKDCRNRNETIVAMLSLETIGYYSDANGSQQYPFPLSLFYPSRGNFIGFVGNLSSRHLVRHVVGTFRRHTQFPSEGGVFPAWLPGIGWSDHWAFWQAGYPALMVTDTALFRYPYYHTNKDTPDRLAFDRMARVVVGLEMVIADLARVEDR